MILTSGATECEAVRQRQAWSLLANLLGVVHLTRVESHYAQAESPQQGAVLGFMRISAIVDGGISLIADAVSTGS